MVGEKGFLNLARGSRPSNPSQRHFPLQLPLNYRYTGCRAERDYCRNPTPTGRKRRDVVRRNRRDRTSSPRSGERKTYRGSTRIADRESQPLPRRRGGRPRPEDRKTERSCSLYFEYDHGLIVKDFCARGKLIGGIEYGI